MPVNSSIVIQRVVITESKIITCGPQNDFQLPIDPNHKHTTDHKVVTVNQMIHGKLIWKVPAYCINYKIIIVIVY